MIEGVSHIGLVVSDLDHTAHLLTRIFDAEEILPHDADSSSATKDRFFRIASLWVVLTEGSSHADRTHDHIAFKIPGEDLEEYRSRIRSLGLEFSEGHSRVPGQSVSLYFHDDDNHLFELQTGTLEQRLGIGLIVKRVAQPNVALQPTAGESLRSAQAPVAGGG